MALACCDLLIVRDSTIFNLYWSLDNFGKQSNTDLPTHAKINPTISRFSVGPATRRATRAISSRKVAAALCLASAQRGRGGRQRGGRTSAGRVHAVAIAARIVSQHWRRIRLVGGKRRLPPEDDRDATLAVLLLDRECIDSVLPTNVDVASKCKEHAVRLRKVNLGAIARVQKGEFASRTE